MKKISFAKLNGAGNDFILFDLNYNPDLVINPAIIAQLCNRRTGIGADGILVISNMEGYDFAMDYYNADGSTGTLCGNGARCAIKYAYLSGKLKNGEARFFSSGKDYTGLVINDQLIRFNLHEPKEFKSNLIFDEVKQIKTADFINTGSPHVVVKIDEIPLKDSDSEKFYEDLNDVPVFELGRAVRYSSALYPEGANVNFIQIKDNKILIRTYERGVEDETFACGTGSVAAALICFYKGYLKPPVTLITKSKEQLIVDFTFGENKITNLSLTGPAEVTFTGEFYSSLYFIMED